MRASAGARVLSPEAEPRDPVVQPDEGGRGADAPPEQVLAVDEHRRRDLLQLGDVPLPERVRLARARGRRRAAAPAPRRASISGYRSAASANTLSTPSAASTRRPVGRRAEGHPRAAPDRHEGPEPERREVRLPAAARAARRRPPRPARRAPARRRPPIGASTRAPPRRPRRARRRPRGGSPRRTSRRGPGRGRRSPATSGSLVPPTCGRSGCSQNRVQATGSTPQASSVSVTDGTRLTTRARASRPEQLRLLGLVLGRGERALLDAGRGASRAARPSRASAPVAGPRTRSNLRFSLCSICT